MLGVEIGSLMKELRDTHGCDVVGVEPNEQRAEAAGLQPLIHQQIESLSLLLILYKDAYRIPALVYD